MDKNILKRKLKNGLIFLIIGFLYLVWIKLTGLAVPCVTRRVTGYKCPGCGATTLVVAIAGFDFKEAFLANRFLLVTLPFLIFELVFVNMREVYGKDNPKWNKILLIIYIVFFVIFGFVRNIMGM